MTLDIASQRPPQEHLALVEDLVIEPPQKYPVTALPKEKLAISPPAVELRAPQESKESAAHKEIHDLILQLEHLFHQQNIAALEAAIANVSREAFRNNIRTLSEVPGNEQTLDDLRELLVDIRISSLSKSFADTDHLAKLSHYLVGETTIKAIAEAPISKLRNDMVRLPEQQILPRFFELYDTLSPEDRVAIVSGVVSQNFEQMIATLPKRDIDKLHTTLVDYANNFASGDANIPGDVTFALERIQELRDTRAATSATDTIQVRDKQNFSLLEALSAEGHSFTVDNAAKATRDTYGEDLDTEILVRILISEVDRHGDDPAFAQEARTLRETLFVAERILVVRPKNTQELVALIDKEAPLIKRPPLTRLYGLDTIFKDDVLADALRSVMLHETVSVAWQSEASGLEKGATSIKSPEGIVTFLEKHYGAGRPLDPERKAHLLRAMMDASDQNNPAMEKTIQTAYAKVGQDTKTFSNIMRFRHQHVENKVAQGDAMYLPQVDSETDKAALFAYSSLETALSDPRSPDFLHTVKDEFNKGDQTPVGIRHQLSTLRNFVGDNPKIIQPIEAEAAARAMNYGNKVATELRALMEKKRGVKGFMRKLFARSETKLDKFEMTKQTIELRRWNEDYPNDEWKGLLAQLHQ